jgi:hypothetical protein
MREIQTATNWEEKTADSISGKAVVRASDLNELFAQVESWKNATLANGSRACRGVIILGKLLLRARDEHEGEFLLWLESNVHFSYETARRYMRLAEKYYTALCDGSLDFQAIKGLYIAMGFMPEPEADHSEPNAPQLPVWARLTTKLDAVIEKLKGEDRERLRQWCQLVLQRL